MNAAIAQLLLKKFNASSIQNEELIQALWSNYGELLRVNLNDADQSSVIVKLIGLEETRSHPRGWNSSLSHQRKVKSYAIESEWYSSWANHCDEMCKVPNVYKVAKLEGYQVIVLEDLDQAGFNQRKSHLSLNEVKIGLKWLANFHAIFLNEKPTGLWKKGTYWHLDTRPDELAILKEGPLKSAAKTIDEKLSNCQYQTIVHGDAKVANFCFNDVTKQVAAVDFQYVGGGCGMKDVIYFLSSCLSEEECELFESEILNYYFNQLKLGLDKTDKKFNFSDLEKEWRTMYTIAWVDFIRFLKGWAPDHYKINTYNETMMNKVLKKINRIDLHH